MFAVGMQRREATDIDVPQVDWGFAADDPFGDELACAAGVGDARRIEASAHEIAAQLRRLAEDEVAVEGKALRTVEQRSHLRGLQAGRAVDRVLHQDPEMIPILGQKLKLEALGDACHVPGLGDRLEPAHDQPPDFLLVVDVAIGIAHHGQVGVHAGNRPRHQVEVFGGEHGHIDARERTELARPLAGAVHDRFAAHFGFMPGRAITHTRHPTPLDDHAGNAGTFDDPRPAHARTLGERLRQVGRIGLAVARNPHRAAEIVGAQERVDLAGFARRDEFEVNAEAFRPRHLPLEELQPLGGLRDVQAAALLPAG